MRLSTWFARAHPTTPSGLRSGRRSADTLSCSVVRDGERLDDFLADWDSLLRRTDNSEPTLLPTWLVTWWRVFGALDGRALRFGIVRDGGRPVGIAPLLGRRHWYRPGVPFRRLELLATGEDEADEICSDYVGLVAERGFEQRVASSVATAIAGGAFGAWDELVMSSMDGDAPLPALLASALGRAGFDVTLEAGSSARYVRLPATFDAYLASLAGSARYMVRRSLRDFDAWAGGTAEFCTAKTLDELERGKRILVTLHGSRWQNAGQAGVFASPRFAAFHDDVMPRLLELGALDLTWLSVRGEPIAALYNIVWNGKVYFYQSGRKPDVPQNVRPGIVLHAHAIRNAIAAGLREYDFLGGTSRYKLALSTDSRPLVTLRAIRSRPLETARRVAERELERLKALLHQPADAREKNGSNGSGDLEPRVDEQ